MTKKGDDQEVDHGDDADAWIARAGELADWADRAFVNRRDIHGGQYFNNQGEILRLTRHAEVTRDLLSRHFAARHTSDVIGLHATAPDETCRWIDIDIDAHDGQGASREANFRFARAIQAMSVRAGLRARLLDTSGARGGYHLWIALDPPIPMARARRLVLWLVRDWADSGLPRRPDLFPGNHRLTGKRCGNWLRLPGRHHKQPDWTTVWSPSRGWLSGHAAIDRLLGLVGRPVDVASIVPADFAIDKPKPVPDPSRRGGTVSIRPVPGSPRTVSPLAERHRRAGRGARDLLLARRALEVYRNIDLEYDDWIEVGIALRNLEDEAAALALFEAWSSTSTKYDAEAAAAKWRSFRPADDSGGITLGTLFRRAMDLGWPGPAFVESAGPLGLRPRTRRSGRRGVVVIPLRRPGEFPEHAIGLPDDQPDA